MANLDVMKSNPDVRMPAADPIILLGAVAVILLAISPLLSLTIPSLGDLSLDMARMQILTNPEAPFLTDWFRLTWAFSPNLGMDLLVPMLASEIGVALATRLFMIATFVLLLSGTLALHHALFSRLTWFPLIGGLFVYNLTTFFGYFNFMFGVGIMLWALAAWFRCQNKSLARRTTIASLYALVLYICNIFPLIIFAFVIVSAEVTVLRRDHQRRPRDIAHSAVAVGVPFVVPLLLFITSPASVQATFAYLFRLKVYPLATLFMTGNLPVDLLVLFGGLAVVVALVKQRAIVISRRLRWFLYAVPAICIIMPTVTFGVDCADARLSAAAIFIAIASVRFHRSISQRFQLGIAITVAALFVVRIAALLNDFSIADREAAAITAQFRDFKPGAVVFSAALGAPKAPLWADPENWQLPWNRDNTLALRQFETTAVLYQPVFVPATSIGKRPVTMVPAYAKLKTVQGDDDRWLADDDEFQAWLDEIHTVLKEPPYQFSAVYITLIDPAQQARLPVGVQERFNQHGYRIWDVTRLTAR